MKCLRKVLARHLRLVARRLDPSPQTITVRLSADDRAFQQAMSGLNEALSTTAAQLGLHDRYKL